MTTQMPYVKEEDLEVGHTYFMEVVDAMDYEDENTIYIGKFLANVELKQKVMFGDESRTLVKLLIKPLPTLTNSKNKKLKANIFDCLSNLNWISSRLAVDNNLAKSPIETTRDYVKEEDWHTLYAIDSLNDNIDMVINSDDKFDVLFKKTIAYDRLSTISRTKTKSYRRLGDDVANEILSYVPLNQGEKSKNKSRRSKS